VSLGRTDLSVVISKNVTLADACATTLGNIITNGYNMEGPLEHVCGIEGISGCLAYCDDKLAVCGDIPEIVRSGANDELITKILLR
jgi:ApbE superfamily uncharacterized protein (UPF0280 family)